MKRLREIFADAAAYSSPIRLGAVAAAAMGVLGATNEARAGTIYYNVGTGIVSYNGETFHGISGNHEYANDSRYECRTNSGPVPQGTHRVWWREKPFFGGAALRIDTSDVCLDGHGRPRRNGVLAHPEGITYQGVYGWSKGCLGIREWDRFLELAREDEPTAIVVTPSADVARLNTPDSIETTQIAVNTSQAELAPATAVRTHGSGGKNADLMGYAGAEPTAEQYAPAAAAIARAYPYHARLVHHWHQAHAHHHRHAEAGHGWHGYHGGHGHAHRWTAHHDHGGPHHYGASHAHHGWGDHHVAQSVRLHLS